jgi:hypothetical protein
MHSFFNSFQSEWLKKRHSAASWLTVIGGFFIPVIILIARFVDFSTVSALNASSQLWGTLYNRCWQFMAIFLLPMGVILTTSLVTQLEFRNNTWKQLHTTPQRMTVIFFAKLAVILVMMTQFFLLFNFGIFLCGVIPSLFKGVPYPSAPFPILSFLKGNAGFFVDCLPIIGLQYLVSLQFRNFLIPIGVGIGLFVASMISLLWKYGYFVPYSYSALDITKKSPINVPGGSFYIWAVGYFTLFIIIGYILYLTKKEKG